MDYTFLIVDILAALSIIGHAIIIGLLGILLAERITKKRNAISRWITSNAMVLMLITATIATAGSLYFSEVAGWTPCKYCWIQRIFMYPQVLLLAIALWKRDKNVARYVLALSIIGALYAAYHYYIQMYDLLATPTNPATPCDASGESCVKTPFTHFGYITIPMMALTAFVLNIIGSGMMLRRTKS